MTRRAGLLARVDQAPCFVPAEWVRRLVHCPVITPMPGEPFGLTLVEGRVVPVLSLGPRSVCALLCDLPGAPGGEPIAITGIDVQRVGFFDAVGQGVSVDTEQIPILDVSLLLASIASNSPPELLDSP